MLRHLLPEKTFSPGRQWGTGAEEQQVQSETLPVFLIVFVWEHRRLA